MALYVLAFSDTDLGAWTSGRRRLRTVKLGAAYAVYERRAAVPDLTDDILRAQYEAVIEIAGRSRATLPARFGALIEERDLVAWARSHDAELRQALDDVRDRVQMTIRVIGKAAPAARTPSPVASGRAYLEARRQSLVPALPEAAQELLEMLRPLVVRERMEAGRGGLLATVYQLISSHDLAAYRRAAAAAPPDAVISGPWPPFAFAPRLW